MSSSSITVMPPVAAAAARTPTSSEISLSVIAPQCSRFRALSSAIARVPMYPEHQMATRNGHNFPILREVLFYCNGNAREAAAQVETALPNGRRDERCYREMSEETPALLTRRMIHNQSATWRELGQYHALTNQFFASPEIRHIDLSGFQGRNWKNIFQTLFTQFPNLESLDLSGCNMREPQIEILTECFKGRTDGALLEMLRLVDPNEALLNEVVDCVRSFETPSFHQKLQELIHACQRHGNRDILQLAKRCQGLLKINLSDCRQITSEAIAILAEGCPNLQRIELAGCVNIHNMGMKALAMGCPNLRYINYAGCGHYINPVARQLATHCPRLEHIDFANCRYINEDSVIDLARMCPNLQYINLSGSIYITDNVVIRLAEKCPRLKHIDLSACPNITDAGVEALAEKCRGLEHIDLTACRHITDASVRAIAERCPELQSISLPSGKIYPSMRTLAERCPYLQKVWDGNSFRNRAEILRDI